MPDLLVIERLAKRYGRGTFVISGMNHVFRPGTATALVGPNGSGKTTLIRLLTALSFPTEGRVRYGPLDVHEHPSRYLTRIGFADDGSLPQYLSALELLEWVARSRNTYDLVGDDGISRLLDEVRLDDRRENLIGTYSSGMVKKTQIAASLCGRPEVLILDEPFRGLDRESALAVEELLLRFKSDGGMIIVATHFADPVDRLCDEILSLPLRNSSH